MSDIALKVHELFNSKPRFDYTFDKNTIFKNGIYVVFEKGEKIGTLDRIVRIGTHNGNNNLPKRLREHYHTKNKNRSVFRKNIGRCFVNQERLDYLPVWNLDLTPFGGQSRKTGTNRYRVRKSTGTAD